MIYVIKSIDNGGHCRTIIENECVTTSEEVALEAYKKYNKDEWEKASVELWDDNGKKITWADSLFNDRFLINKYY